MSQLHQRRQDPVTVRASAANSSETMERDRDREVEHEHRDRASCGDDEPQVRARPHIPQSVAQTRRPGGCPPGGSGGCVVSARHHREGRGVDQNTHPVPRRRSSTRDPHQPGGVEVGAVQRDRVDHLIRRHQVGDDDRLPGGPSSAVTTPRSPRTPAPVRRWRPDSVSSPRAKAWRPMPIWVAESKRRRS